MNTHFSQDAKPLRIAAIGLGLILGRPALAQQDDMRDMQMPPAAASSSAPTPASSSMQSMQGKKHQRAAAPASANSTHAEHGTHMSSMQDMPMQHGTSSAAPAPASSSAPSTQALEMHDTDMSSIQGMHGEHQVPMQPSKPVELQHLDFGNTMGMRPESGGLAEASHGMDMHSMQDMDMASMQGGKAPPDARSPDYSDGYRYTDMPGMAMSDHAKQGMLLIDQLEVAHDNHGNNAVFLDGQFWYGRDFNKLWLKFEGEQAHGKLEDLRTEALWSHAISAYWNTQLGIREDLGEGPNRTWAAFGIEGLAPYWFETEAAVYVGQNGRTAARFQVEYEELLTQRLVLQPKFEVNLYGKDDPEHGIGSGLSDAELGLRLRYEIKREFAPYVGVVWRQRFGRTADLYRAQGEPASDLQFVAGFHFWF
ncbi:MAG TPA: copper resistance protein B [Rhodanobacteraceae bacterium]|nr:copper resistance protein B [Rhodanobacteraceae bacterium]